MYKHRSARRAQTLPLSENTELALKRFRLAVRYAGEILLDTSLPIHNRAFAFRTWALEIESLASAFTSSFINDYDGDFGTRHYGNSPA